MTSDAAHALVGDGRVPVFDGHNDLPWERREAHGYSVAGLDVEKAGNTLHTDLPKLRRGGVAAQFWSVFVHTSLQGADAGVATLEQIDCVRRLVAAYPEELALATTAREVELAWRSGRIASLMGAEGGHQIADSVAALRMFALLGVRYLTLTWNEHTSWADCAVLPERHGGLTDRGRDIVREMNRIGVIVDLSHVSAKTMADALDCSTSPVLFSHSCCLELGRHPRDVPDEILRRLPDNGGVLMLAFVAPFLSRPYSEWLQQGERGDRPPVTVADLADHVEYARELAGVDHIGIGADFDGSMYFPDDVQDVSRYPVLFDELAARGWSAEDLDKLGYRNALRVLAANDPAYESFRAGVTDTFTLM